jgi:putative membrane protein
MAPLRLVSRTLGRPAPSFLAFSVLLLAWHVPALFDATLRLGTLHALEHTLFFCTAIMFWKQLIPSPPLHVRLAAGQRVLYSIGGMTVSWVLAVVLALSRQPLYSHYAHLTSRPGGISAIADQQLAAGIMWVPGSITFLIVVFVYVHRWLNVPEAASASAPRLASEH